jgi:Peptidase A4 family
MRAESGEIDGDRHPEDTHRAGLRRVERTLAFALASSALLLPGALASFVSPTSETGRAVSPAHVVSAIHGPALTGTHSDQTWSGYAVTGSGPYISITGRWNIPTMNCANGPGDASPWIGIDGWSNDTVEQIGIDLDCRHGTPSYHPWVEMYPGPSDYFKETVHAGDTLTASVRVSGSSWVLSETDLNTGWTKTFDETSSDQLASAEAIIEDVGNGGAPPVPDFNTVSFSKITVNGSPLASAGTVHKTTLRRGSTKLSSESSLTGGKFSITWLHN